MMNNGSEDQLYITCKVGNSSFRFFPNKNYEGNLIAMLVMNCVLLISTILLNGISVITIKKSSVLKGKVCYFVILVQSVVDLGVGLLSIPLFISYLIFPFVNTGNCTLIILSIGASYLPPGFSVVTLSAMTIERYIAVLHPYSYQTRVTKKRILTYVCGVGLAQFSVLAYFFRDRNISSFIIHCRLHKHISCDTKTYSFGGSASP